MNHSQWICIEQVCGREVFHAWDKRFWIHLPLQDCAMCDGWGTYRKIKRPVSVMDSTSWPTSVNIIGIELECTILPWDSIFLVPRGYDIIGVGRYGWYLHSKIVLDWGKNRVIMRLATRCRSQLSKYVFWGVLSLYTYLWCIGVPSFSMLWVESYFTLARVVESSTVEMRYLSESIDMKHLVTEDLRRFPASQNWERSLVGIAESQGLAHHYTIIW